jgi:manganese efflux pump family protein
VVTAAPTAHSGALSLATLLSWIFTASIGAYMLRSLVRHGALHRQRSVRDGLSPRILYGHFSLALSGLVVWAAFLATGWGPLTWVAVALLTPAIGLGICTVTLWTPYPRPLGEPAQAAGPGQAAEPGQAAGAGRPSDGRRAGRFTPATFDAVPGRVTDATLARALTDEALAARLIDEVIASLPEGTPRRPRKPRVYPAAVIPFGHGLAALATFTLAVVTAVGAH